MSHREPDPAGTGGARCGSRKRRGCGQPVRWAWVQDAAMPHLSTRIPLEPGVDPDGRLLQVGWKAGDPLVRAMRRHETVPAGGKTWVPHHATCPHAAGLRNKPVRRPVTVQLELPVDAAGCRPARDVVTAVVRR